MQHFRFVGSSGFACAPVQVLQWVFAAAPGHPALRDMCDHIARSGGAKFSASTNVYTLERTGPGAWTDVVLRHARAHPPSKVRRPVGSRGEAF